MGWNVYNSSGDLKQTATKVGDTTISAVADGSIVNLPTTIAANSSISLSSSYTNTSGVTVYARFSCGGRYETEPVATGLQERLISMMLRIQSGGATTGTVKTTGGVGTESFTDMSRVTLAATTIKTRHRITSELIFELAPSQVAAVDVLTRCLENLVGWRGSVANGGEFQAVDGYWEIMEKK